MSRLDPNALPGVARRQVTFLASKEGDPAVPPLRGAFDLTNKLGGCATRPGQLAQNASCCGARTVLAFFPIYPSNRSGTERDLNITPHPHPSPLLEGEGIYLAGLPAIRLALCARSLLLKSLLRRRGFPE
jgi:hypothetical protein